MPKPSPRRDGREAAIQYLFGHETLGESETDEETLELFWSLREAKSKAREFAAELIAGVRTHQAAIDLSIASSLENFKMSRLNKVDRNILRLGAYEICYADYIPPQAALNEAIEIAKRFGTEESPKFINGVLDRILRETSTKET